MLIYMSSQQHFQGFQGNLPVIKIIFFKTLFLMAINYAQSIRKALKNNPLYFW
jgi:hypothetical protein